uniref:Rad50/SbcC-type AAA domain-containing protein n=1 Tax=Thermodesulfobacterium geofontis TaxID=1295609 RepID=A0A7V5XGS6_9BACT
MKIKEFLIIRYGPLKIKKPILLNSFNLLWGKNEEGKTLTIDALIKLLIEGDIKSFENIDRVEEKPEGYVIIRDASGKDIKFPEKRKKTNLNQLTNLTSQEFRNIFIIRNSDLSISKESEFYTNITEKLTGILKTKDILKIKNKLLEIGNLTPSGEFKDDKPEKLKTRLNNAQQLIEKISKLERKIKENRFDELEKDLIKSKEEIEKIDKELEILEIARKREKYEIGKRALDKLKESFEKLKNLKNYNERDWEIWRDCENKVKDYVSQKEEGLKKVEEREIKLKEVGEKLNEIERDFKIFEERKKKIDNEIKPELKNYQYKSEEIAQQKEKDKFFTYLGIVSATLLGISLIGSIFSSLPLFYILALGFLVIAIISGLFKFQLIKNKAQLAEKFEKIRFSLLELGMEAKNIERVLFNLEKFEEEYGKIYEEFNQMKVKKEKIEEEIRELRDKKIPHIEEEIQKTKENIEEIKKKSGEELLEKYKENLKLKEELEKIIGEQRGILKTYFGEIGENLEDKIAYWEKEIKEFEKYVDKAVDIKYSETLEEALKNKKRELEDKVKNLTNKIENLKGEMKEIEREINTIFQLDEYLYCSTLADLKEFKENLQKFVEENKNRRDTVLEVKRIFEEIETEEIEKISGIFGKESLISKYFAEITEGRYEEVIFDQETRKIKVKLKEGALLETEKLSGGAYDQLYFSIRLALGEKLLKGDKGFFILDDPFIKSDPYRLKKQVEMLKKISELGWQIIYFSAKGEIRDILDEEIKSGTIKYIEIQEILA